MPSSKDDGVRQNVSPGASGYTLQMHLLTLGWSGRQAAARFNIPPATFNRILNGDGELNPHESAWLAELVAFLREHPVPRRGSLLRVPHRKDTTR